MNSFFETRFDALRVWLDDQRTRRRTARTRRFLDSLPEDIRKDIGWPDGRAMPAPLPAVERKWDAETFLARTQCRI